MLKIEINEANLSLISYGAIIFKMDAGPIVFNETR